MRLTLALRRVAWHDRVANLDRGDTLADGLDDRGRFVAEDRREEAFGTGGVRDSAQHWQ